MKTTILLLFITLGCTGALEEQVDSNKTLNIEGKWKFEKFIETKEFKFQKSVKKNEDSFTLNDFFGAEAIAELPGKSIEFKDDERVNTDWIDQNILDKIDFEYALDKSNSQIVFSAVSPKDNSQVTIPTKIVYEDTIMFWQISENQSVKLKRIE